MGRKTPIMAAALGATLAAAAATRRMTRFEIVDRSMEPSLFAGDYVVAVRPGRELRRGSIVVFPHPGTPGFDLVKRIVGLPGEHVALAAGAVAVNGVVLEEPWTDGPTYPEASWRLGPDEVFLLGDRRPDSAADSRTMGPVSRTAVRWRVVGRYRPFRRAGRLVPPRSSR